MGLPLDRLSLDDYLVWESDQPERYEFHRGDTYLMVGGTARHNRVILNLASHFGDVLDGTPCQVLAENMKVLAEEAVLYPDLTVTCTMHEAGDELMVADPVLIVEVLSPSTSGYDRRDKFILYRTLSSLREYVLIDPSSRHVEVFERMETGGWLLTDHTHAEPFRLASIACDVPMTTVFKGVDRSAG